jgi:hypothetical protein
MIIAAHLDTSEDGTRWLMLRYGNIDLGYLADEGTADEISERAVRDLRRKRRSVTATDLLPVISEALA